MRGARMDRNRLRNCLHSKRRHTPVAQLVEQAAHNRQVVGSSPTGSTLKRRKIMFNSVWTAITLGVVSLTFFVYSLVKHEERLQVMEQKISAAQEKFTEK